MADETQAADAAPPEDVQPAPASASVAADSPASCPICAHFLRNGFCSHCGFQE